MMCQNSFPADKMDFIDLENCLKYFNPFMVLNSCESQRQAFDLSERYMMNIE